MTKNALCLDIVCHRQLDLAESRKCYLDVVNKLIFHANTNESKSTTQTVTITFEHFAIAISFKNTLGKYPKEKIAMINKVNGNICYQTFKNNRLIVVHTETYEEAMKAMQK